MLSKDYPQLCYYYFCVWSEKKEDSRTIIFDEILKKLVREFHTNVEEKKIFVFVVDSQSVKNTNIIKEKGYDEKIS